MTYLIFSHRVGLTFLSLALSVFLLLYRRLCSARWESPPTHSLALTQHALPLSPPPPPSPLSPYRSIFASVSNRDNYWSWWNQEKGMWFTVDLYLVWNQIPQRSWLSLLLQWYKTKPDVWTSVVCLCMNKQYLQFQPHHCRCPPPTGVPPICSCQMLAHSAAQ